MSSENDVTDRLLSEARKKSDRQSDGATTGKVALGVGIVALLVSPISILGWIVGLAALVTGLVAVRRPASAKLAKIAMTLGVAAILVGVFFFTLNLAQMM